MKSKKIMAWTVTNGGDLVEEEEEEE